MTQSKPKPEPKQILNFLEWIMADINQTGCALKKCFVGLLAICPVSIIFIKLVPGKFKKQEKS